MVDACEFMRTDQVENQHHDQEVVPVPMVAEGARCDQEVVLIIVESLVLHNVNEIDLVQAAKDDQTHVKLFVDVLLTPMGARIHEVGLTGQDPVIQESVRYQAIVIGDHLLLSPDHLTKITKKSETDRKEAFVAQELHQLLRNLIDLGRIQHPDQEVDRVLTLPEVVRDHIHLRTMKFRVVVLWILTELC